MAPLSGGKGDTEVLAAAAELARPFDAAAHIGLYGPLRMLAVRTRNRETILIGRDVS